MCLAVRVSLAIDFGSMEFFAMIFDWVGFGMAFSVDSFFSVTSVRSLRNKNDQKEVKGKKMAMNL